MGGQMNKQTNDYVDRQTDRQTNRKEGNHTETTPQRHQCEGLMHLLVGQQTLKQAFPLS